MGASHDERLRTSPLAAGELRVFALMLLPVVVLILGHGLFEIVGRPFADHVAMLPRPESAGSRLQESLQGGQAWAATALTFLVVGLSALAFLFHLLRSYLGGRAALPFLAAAAGLACVGWGHLAVAGGRGHAVSAIFLLTYGSLTIGGFLDPLRHLSVGGILGLINGLSILVTAVVVSFLPLCLLAPTGGWTEETLVRRIKDGRQVAVMASAFLVAGVLHMYAWMQWSALLLGLPGLERIAGSVTLYWSCVFTLMLATLYLPLLVVLHGKAMAVMGALGVPVEGREDWLKQHGLSFNAFSQLPQLAAISAPLLASPLSQLLKTVPVPIGVG